jgi:chromate transporter
MRPSLSEIAREWTRVGCIGFGGPPTRGALLGGLCFILPGLVANRSTAM